MYQVFNREMAAFNTQEKARKLRDEAKASGLEQTETSDSKAAVSDVQDGREIQKDIPVSGKALLYFWASVLWFPYLHSLLQSCLL